MICPQEVIQAIDSIIARAGLSGLPYEVINSGWLIGELRSWLENHPENKSNDCEFYNLGWDRCNLKCIKHQETGQPVLPDFSCELSSCPKKENL
jgi:hypothetical protein